MDTPNLSVGDRLAEARTALAFQRTRLAADRTMMAVLRTSLSMIGFGFTIFAFFQKLSGKTLLGDAIPQLAPARFGLSLVALGIVTLAIGIYGQFRFMRSARTQRNALVTAGLLPADDPFPLSPTLVIAFLLLLIGLFAILSIAARAGPLA